VNARSFLILYKFEPDASMHTYGCYSQQAKMQIGMINRQVEEMLVPLIIIL